MNQYLLLGISLAGSLTGSVVKKTLSDRYRNGNFERFLFSAVTSAVAAAGLAVYSGSLRASGFTILLGAVFGLTTAIQSVFNMRAIETGPYSYTTVLGSLSMIIPALSGAVLWDEKISAVQIVGIVLMAACFVLSANFKGDEKKATLRWLLYCLVSFFTTGAIGVMQKWHQNTGFKDELDAFLVIAFAVSFVFSIVTALVCRKRDGAGAEGKKLTAPVPLALMAVAGAGIALCNKLNLYLSGAMDSAVFFPVFNGSILMLVTLVAVVFFKERLTGKQWIGMAVGACAVILLCDPVKF